MVLVEALHALGSAPTRWSGSATRGAAGALTSMPPSAPATAPAPTSNRGNGVLWARLAVTA
ncbi:MAG TPA: hypothetical protein VIL85_27720 [Thermomicrobiales bacterium]